ncbi:MAG: hypothetical protein A2Y84_00855 [Candidatus Colwellbacteria bacterium RBG_13_48_8]|uniref:Uncharacterized protein n=1 Tax=Candidatus Colwellbacteria bacterium RBG_13_48_8 TaxID=1797685 RepID=A0A1G1YUV3_9BACT|nr:MAG: hypothetical protein A2Y84_00855 [Candidatus Colwellbacteria bacterium RBG_13_48_8]
MADVPREIRQWLASDPTFIVVERINDRFSFLGDQRAVIPTALSLLVIKELEPSNFIKVLGEKLGISEERVEPVAFEIKGALLEPIQKQLSDYGIDIRAIHTPNELLRGGSAAQRPQVPTPQPSQSIGLPKSSSEDMGATTTPVPTLGRREGPTVQEEQQGLPANPLIIHEHRGAEENKAPVDYSGGLVRPSFYTPPNTPSPEDEGEYGPTPKARLELSNEPQAQETAPATTKVGKEEARVVHYTTPETPPNPFGGQNQPQAKAGDRPSIPPSHVVDLKDLPQ